MPVSLAHRLGYLVNGEVFALRIVGAATQRAMRKHVLEQSPASGCDHAAFAQCHHVLLLMETEDSNVTERSGLTTLVLGSSSMSGIFHDEDAPRAGQCV